MTWNLLLFLLVDQLNNLRCCLMNCKNYMLVFKTYQCLLLLIKQYSLK